MELQDWLSTGLPPLQPLGDDDVTV